MDSSPLSAPESFRTSASSPLDDNLNRPKSPLPDDAQTTLSAEDFDGDSELVPDVPDEGMNKPAEPARAPITKAPKGKEKARKGPLRLLDLPVDVLKEIIHQVCSRPKARCAHETFKLTLQLYSSLTPTTSPRSPSATRRSTGLPFHASTLALILCGQTRALTRSPGLASTHSRMGWQPW
jgi:hypothetical protein